MLPLRSNSLLVLSEAEMGGDEARPKVPDGPASG